MSFDNVVLIDSAMTTGIDSNFTVVLSELNEAAISE